MCRRGDTCLGNEYHEPGTRHCLDTLLTTQQPRHGRAKEQTRMKLGTTEAGQMHLFHVR